MNPDLHMADDLKNTGKGNLFVVFGEPDMIVEPVPERARPRPHPHHRRGRVRPADRRHPLRRHQEHRRLVHRHRLQRGEFLRPPRLFPRRATTPTRSLKTALRAEIDEEAWATLYRDISRPFRRPATGRIAVKVINHFGDEVMKVFSL